MAELTALESLIEMGFPRGRAEKALALTGNQGIEAAMDWLMEHEDDPDVDEPLETPIGHMLGREPTSSEQGGPEGPGSVAGEGKPILSEEERQEQTKRMLELVAQKQREREEREEREALEREKQRRRQGQELSVARQRLQEDEMRRAAEERRREKAEEQRVREKIERDKAERAKKYGGSVGSRPSPPAPELGPVPSSPSQEPPTKREYDQCRIQVRLPDGTSLTQTFRAREQLAAVRLYVELHCGEEPGGGQDPVQLLSGFPRRAFSEADMERPLQELGMACKTRNQDWGWGCERMPGKRRDAKRRLCGDGLRPGILRAKNRIPCCSNLFSSIFRTCAFCCPHSGQEMSQLRGLYPIFPL
ncbi:UBX domain-containing protein 1 isoform X2 [Carlito syrichta]|uniref:UBX domain-containing protein 1 n=1 Tax=Carlito syrichta TaxID=1868482 RepID=A0A3Q0DNB8_CARSF|nr:UBX domain-containing protein 1 isoform X2 [Carlito syrichta]